MTNSRLNRKQLLRAKNPIHRVSLEHRKEIAKRTKLKQELIDKYGEHCMTCGDLHRDFRGISLSHIIPLSRGGKTVLGNLLLECGYCHDKYEKRPELREESNANG